jgi:hypothetical protein
MLSRRTFATALAAGTAAALAGCASDDASPATGTDRDDDATPGTDTTATSHPPTASETDPASPPADATPHQRVGPEVLVANHTDATHEVTVAVTEADTRVAGETATLAPDDRFAVYVTDWGELTATVTVTDGPTVSRTLDVDYCVDPDGYAFTLTADGLDVRDHRRTVAPPTGTCVPRDTTDG